MKATELMIGDWVNVPMAKLTARIDSILSKREAHNDACIVVDFNGQGYLAHYTEKDLEPIPLTAEILEKNGFTWTGGGDRSQMKMTDFFEKEQRWHIYVHHNTKTFDVHTSFPIDHPTIQNWRRSNSVKMEVCGFYVHELQHALRLCGLNELADSIII